MKQNLVVYVCGRRTGIPDKGYAAIEGCAAHLRSLGHQVISPIDVNINALGNEYSPTHDVRFRPGYPGLRMDIITMMGVCNAIAMMPGWDKAVGCRLEVAIAISFGFAFIDWQTGEVIERPEQVIIDQGYSNYTNERIEREHMGAPSSRFPFHTEVDSPARIG